MLADGAKGTEADFMLLITLSEITLINHGYAGSVMKAHNFLNSWSLER